MNTKKALWVVLGLGCGAIACSVSPVVNTGAAADAGVGNCNEPGSSACESTLTALCERWVQCCSAPGASACQPWATSESQCLAYWTAEGYDCESSTYAAYNVCSDTTSACQGDIPLVACADMYGATANWPASCSTFWQQYPAPPSTVNPPPPPVVEDAGEDCTQSASSACEETLTALCSRWVDCCDAPGAPACQPWATDENQCLSYWAGQGYDCASPTYSQYDVCAGTTTACQNDIPTIACSDMYGATANWPATCTTFWQQFN